MNYTLVCTGCGCRYGSDYDRQICESCDGILDVVYSGAVRIGRPSRFWDMEGVFPDSNYRHLDVGWTRLSKSTEFDNLLLKYEFDNPTGSFKDRGSVVEIAKAKEFGYHEVTCASTGNMAYSVAYYSKIYGIRSVIFISKDANRDKIRNIRSTNNSRIVRVDGDFTDAQAAAIRYSDRTGSFLTGDYCYRKEGQKSMAYEIMHSSRGIEDIIVPIGNATLFSGFFRGLLEMRKMGRIGDMPRLIGVEAAGCAPIADALDESRDARYVRPRTDADAIAVGMPTFWRQAVEAIRATGGKVVRVTDAEMRKEQRDFYISNGLIVELGGIASLAAFRKLGADRGRRTVAILSGKNV